MTATAWIALAALSFTVITTVVGTIVAGVLWISRKFDAHEKEDQGRHIENIQRFAKIDLDLATIIRNGHGDA